MALSFAKYQGIGNDFVLVDTTQGLDLVPDPSAAAKRLCDRRFGIGGDGLVLVSKADEGRFRMQMFNPDGSESEMCGNATRCVGLFLKRAGYLEGDTFELETGGGTLPISALEDGRFRVRMGIPKLRRGEIGIIGPPGHAFLEAEIGEGYRGTAVSMGNPHLVIFVPSVDGIELSRLGPKFEHHNLFPARTNVHFAQVIDRGRITQRTWERGAGITLACGSGACAVAVAAALTDRTDRQVVIKLPGGELEISLDGEGAVWMTGVAEFVFEGTIEL